MKPFPLFGACVVLAINWSTHSLHGEGQTVLEFQANEFHSGVPLVGQMVPGVGVWQLRADNETSPMVGFFDEEPSLVSDPDAPNVVSAILPFKTSFKWLPGESLAVEFEATVASRDEGSFASVGIGSNSGGVPPQAILSASRFQLREQNFGAAESARDPSGQYIDLEPLQLYRIRATWKKSESSDVPVGSMTIQKLGSSEEPPAEAFFGPPDAVTPTIPAGPEGATKPFEFINLFWLRVQGDATIRSVKVTHIK